MKPKGLANRGYSSNCFPTPFTGVLENDPRIAAAKSKASALAYLAPSFFAIHPIDPQAPEEDVLLLDYQFMSQVSEAVFYVPSYASW